MRNEFSRQCEVAGPPQCISANRCSALQLDCILMLWGYAMPKPGEEHWRVVWRTKPALKDESAVVMPERSPAPLELLEGVLHESCSEAEIHHAPEQRPSNMCNGVVLDPETGNKEELAITETPTKAVPISSRTKSETYSDLSIVLTLISILDSPSRDTTTRHIEMAGANVDVVV